MGRTNQETTRSKEEQETIINFIKYFEPFERLSVTVELDGDSYKYNIQKLETEKQETDKQPPAKKIKK